MPCMKEKLDIKVKGILQSHIGKGRDKKMVR